MSLLPAGLLDWMALKGPFQPQPVHDFFDVLEAMHFSEAHPQAEMVFVVKGNSTRW